MKGTAGLRAHRKRRRSWAAFSFTPQAACPPTPGSLKFSLPENKGKEPTLQPGPQLGLGVGESKKHPRGRVSELGSGPGTAHFLLRRCKPQAEPSGNRVTTKESPAARTRFGGACRGPHTGEGFGRREFDRA